VNDQHYLDTIAELGAVSAGLRELVDVVSGDFLAVPRRYIFDAQRTMHEFHVNVPRAFHSVMLENPTDYPLYVSYAAGRGGQAADYDDVIEPRTGAILTRPYDTVSIGFDAAARPAGSATVLATFYARPLPPTRWSLNGTQIVQGQVPISAAGAPAGSFPVDHAYAKGKVVSLGTTPLVGGGGIASANLVTAGYQWLFLIARIGNATTPATAAGDIGVFASAADDDSTFPLVIDSWSSDGTVVTRAPTLNGNTAFTVKRINLAGVDFVRVNLQNNNVAALQGGTAIYYLQK
jgi:hypothetical protein